LASELKAIKQDSESVQPPLHCGCGQASGVETPDEIADILFGCRGEGFVDKEFGKLLRGEYVTYPRVLCFAANEKPSPESLDELIVVEDSAD
jgi:hypothetical protein